MGNKKKILLDKNGTPLYENDRVVLTDNKGKQIAGKLVYDNAFWAHAVHGDDGKRYLLMDVLYSCLDLEVGFGWEAIRKECPHSEQVADNTAYCLRDGCFCDHDSDDDEFCDHCGHRLIYGHCRMCSYTQDKEKEQGE